MSDGLSDIFHGAKRPWCTQHMQERDLYKLKGLGANQRPRARIMAMSEEHVPAEVVAVIHHLNTCAEDVYLEEVRSIRGLGKYRLAPGYNLSLIHI